MWFLHGQVWEGDPLQPPVTLSLHRWTSEYCIKIDTKKMWIYVLICRWTSKANSNCIQCVKGKSLINDDADRPCPKQRHSTHKLKSTNQLTDDFLMIIWCFSESACLLFSNAAYSSSSFWLGHAAAKLLPNSSVGAQTHVSQSGSEFPHWTRKGGVCPLPTYLPSGSGGAWGWGEDEEDPPLHWSCASSS